MWTQPLCEQVWGGRLRVQLQWWVLVEAATLPCTGTCAVCSSPAWAPAALLCKALTYSGCQSSGTVPDPEGPVSRPLLLTGTLSAGMLYILPAWKGM